MEIIYNKYFVKSYKKLQNKDQKLVDKTLKIFAKNPHNPILRNHELKGNKKGIHSIDVKFDLRILFLKKGNYIKVIMLEIGTHSQIYG